MGRGTPIGATHGWTIQACPVCGPAPGPAGGCLRCGGPLDEVEVVPAAQLDAERRRGRELERALRDAGVDPG